MKRTTIKNTIATLGIGIVIPFSSMATSFAATPAETYNAADKATNYLKLQQQADGSIAGNPGASDWAAIAFAAAGITANTQLTSYVAHEAAPATVTGIERKILALAATGQATSGYTALLATHYQANQIGDTAYLNDDWFGVMAIIASKDTADYHIAADAVNYIVAHQDASGGFSYCADATQLYCGVDSNDTAAALIALVSAQKAGLTNANLSTAITTAIDYLKTTKQSDGGFGYDNNAWTTASDSASTSWVLMALNTVTDSSLSTIIDAARAQLIATQDTATGSYGYEWNGYNADTITTANATLALVGTNWLLSPAPLDRPLVEKPTETPAITTPSSTVAATTTSSGVTTPTVTTAAAVDTTEPVTSAISETSAAATVEGTPQVKAASTNKATAEKITANNTARTIGISLIALATIGFVAYGLILRRRRLQ